MSKYDDAERHAIKELDPQGYVKWQMPGLDPDLEWYTWLESQVSPPVGMPQLRCDCVAGFRSGSGKQAPWAGLIEAQAQPIPRLGVWVMVYLGLLHEDLRHGPHDRDRFQMMAAVVNLTDTTLSTSIDWAPPISPPAPESAPEPIGVKCRFWVRNVREENAEQTLEQIGQGKTALCILPWLPLMSGGDQPPIFERWKELAMRQDQRHVRADYVALALVFAELAGREAAWSAALKEFDVKDSRIAQQWEDKGIQKGAAALRASVLRVLRARFPGMPIPAPVVPALDKLADLEQLTRWVEEASVTSSLDQFQQDLSRSLPANGVAPTSA